MESSSIFVGIELQHAWRMYTFAALDANLKLLALRQGRLPEVVAYLAEDEAIIAAISAPRQPNLGRMQRDEIRSALFAPLPGNHSADLRQVEYELLARGLPVPRTPSKTASCPAWMRRGFRLVQELNEIGYAQFNAAGARRQLIETVPEVVFTSLLGHAPFPSESMEGRIQRQLILWDHRLPVRDPMVFFEEVTRHKLLLGMLPKELIYAADELDALMAANVAYVAGRSPKELILIGDRQEGQIALPVAALKERYS